MITIDWKPTTLLFSKYDLRTSLESGRKELLADVERASLSADSSDEELDRIAASLTDKHSVTVPAFNEADIYTSTERRQLDVSRDFNRAILDPSRPYMIDLETIVFHVPFTGEQELFYMRGSSFTLNPPRAEVGSDEICIAVMVEGEATPEEVKQPFESELARIRQHLRWLSTEVGEDYDSRLTAEARAALEARRARQSSTRGLLDGLGFKTAPTPSSPVPAPASRQAPSTTAAPSVPLPEKRFEFDFFISHASEDKAEVARPLFKALVGKGYKVWFDEAEPHIGDSLLDKIDEGLANCRFGIVIMSPTFFEKKWTQDELKGLRSRQISDEPGLILPVWKDIDVDFLNGVHPSLAQLKAMNFADGLEAVVADIELVYER